MIIWLASKYTAYPLRSETSKVGNQFFVMECLQDELPKGAPRYPSTASKTSMLTPRSLRDASKFCSIFAGLMGQRRAKISGNWLTIFLVRTRVAAPGGPRAKSTPGKSREVRVRDAGGGIFRHPSRGSWPPQKVPKSLPKGRQGAPRGPQEAPKEAPWSVRGPAE